MLNRRSPVDQKILETLPHNERGSIRSKQRAELQPWPLKQTVEAQQVMLWRVVAMIQSVQVNQGQPPPYLLTTSSAQHRLNRWNRSVRTKSAGIKHRRFLNAPRQTADVSTVSARALMVEYWTFPSFDQLGINPHFNASSERSPVSGLRRIVKTGCDGAMFQLIGKSD